MALRIAFVSWKDLAHPQAGGSEVLIDRLLRGLQHRGHHVALMAGSPVEPRPYPVFATGGRLRQYLQAPLVHSRRTRDWDLLVDVDNGIPYFSPLWRRRPILCLVHHIHLDQWRLNFPAPVAAFGRGLERWAMPLAYRRKPFVAVSPSTADALEALGIRRQQIAIVPNGVDVPEDPHRDDSPEPLFVALGRLSAHKRLDLALRAWERVRREIGGRLVIAGEGPERARLAAMAGEGVEMPGRIDDAERDRLLRSAWLLIHPALHEGWGIVILEAAAFGMPTLAFDVPGVRDAVVDGRTGVLVECEDEFVARWIGLARDLGQRRELGSAGRERAQRFSWSATVDRFMDAAESAIAGGPMPLSLASLP